MHPAIHTIRTDVTARARAAWLVIAAGCLTLALAGCVPEPAGPEASAPAPQPSSSQQPSTDPSAPATSQTPNAALATLPEDCTALYSPAMLQTLNEQNPPLNDPGVTMNSTEVVAGLELLDSGAPTIRCSWGVPSSFGLATNVTIVTQAQADGVGAALRERGFSCETTGDETRCEMTERFSDPNMSGGETHVLRANAWVSTHWLNFAPAGYTDDIVKQLFG